MYKKFIKIEMVSKSEYRLKIEINIKDLRNYIFQGSSLYKYRQVQVYDFHFF